MVSFTQGLYRRQEVNSFSKNFLALTEALINPPVFDNLLANQTLISLESKEGNELRNLSFSS